MTTRIWFALFACLTTVVQAEPLIRRFGAEPTRRAVLVDDAALAHTGQLLAAASATDSHEEEIRSVFARLSATLAQLDAAPSDLIKVNLYAVDEPTVAAAIDFLRKWTDEADLPAVMHVISELPKKRAFALDAVFVAESSGNQTRAQHLTGAGQNTADVLGGKTVSVLPKGDVVYVSGQAQPGELAAATESTLEGLLATLRFLDLERSDMVQLKCFLRPMSQVAVVEQQIADFFGEAPVPAVSYVEWVSSGSRPIEIECIAAAPASRTDQTISYATPPDMKASPVFSRVARIHGDRRIYVSGLFADESATAEDEVPSIFRQLIRQLKPTGSNLRHLAKATYYVADADSSSQLNQVRPHYFDPARPPAASKALVRGIGTAGASVAIDMIAAPEAALVSVLKTRSKSLRPDREVTYKTVGDRQLKLHVFEPEGHRPTDRRTVLLAVHGGGWTGGKVRDFYPLADHFAEQGLLGISLEYRLKNGDDGTTVFDCVRDVRSAVRWIREHAEGLGVDPDKIVVLGGSAGGHLAVSTALFDSVNDQRDDLNVSAQADALILMYPVIDTSAEGYGQAKIGPRWRELSPVHHVRGSLPPMLLFHGTADAVTPHAGAQRFHDRAVAAGNSCRLVTHPGGRHGYIIFDPTEFQRALEEMQSFLRNEDLLKESSADASQ